MIVEPDIFSHPKFIHLKSLIGDVALEYLARLWAHCHGKRGEVWTGATSEYVEVICTGHSHKGHIFAKLELSGWVTKLSDGIQIKNWEDHNATLVARWHRPTQTPAQVSAQLPTQTPAQVSAQLPTQTPVSRTRVMRRSGRGPEETRQDKTRGEGTPSPDSSFSDVGAGQKNGAGDAHLPTLAEVQSFGAAYLGDAARGIPANIPPDYCERFYERTTVNCNWLTKDQQNLKDWRLNLTIWWRKDWRNPGLGFDVERTAWHRELDNHPCNQNSPNFTGGIPTDAQVKEWQALRAAHPEYEGYKPRSA